nr:hypothetical protein GZ9C4_31 [uncultured archaeon GZfos9C4]
MFFFALCVPGGLCGKRAQKCKLYSDACLSSGGNRLGMPSSIGYRWSHFRQYKLPFTIPPFPSSSSSTLNSKSPLHIGQASISISSFFISSFCPLFLKY